MSHSHDLSTFQNRLLALLSDADRSRLQPHLEWIDLPRHFVIAEPDQPVQYAYFLESGLGSMVATSLEGQQAESRIFGRDGVAPSFVVFGIDQGPQRQFMQLAGEGYRIALSQLRQAIDASSALRNLLLRYAHTYAIQTSFTALSNAVHPVQERLARWILMCHDRSTSDDIPLTHDFLAIMLAVRRPSVTTALHVLEGNRFIRSDRGYITVVNRQALEEFASDGYGKPEAEYRRLIGAL